MKMKSWITAAGLGLFLSSGWAGAVEGTVFDVSLSLSGAIQDDLNMQPRIERVKPTADNLISLALGQPPENGAPSNTALWLRYDCQTGVGTLDVVNTSNGSTLVTLGDVEQTWSVEAVAQVEGIMVIELNDVGDLQNGINGGFLVVAFKAKKSGDCAAKIQGTVMGVLDVTVTDEDGTFSADVVVAKGKMTATRINPL